MDDTNAIIIYCLKNYLENDATKADEAQDLVQVIQCEWMVVTYCRYCTYLRVSTIISVKNLQTVFSYIEATLVNSWLQISLAIALL